MSLHIFPSYRLLVHWSSVYTWQVRFQATRNSAVFVLIDAFRPLMLFTYIGNRLLASVITKNSQINKVKARSCDNPPVPVAWQPVPFISRKTCWNSDISKITCYCRIAPFLPWLDSPSGPRPPRCRGFTITHRYRTLGSPPVEEGLLARRTELYLI